MHFLFRSTLSKEDAGTGFYNNDRQRKPCLTTFNFFLNASKKRVACPKFRHLALSSEFYNYNGFNGKISQWIPKFQIFESQNKKLKDFFLFF